MSFKREGNDTGLLTSLRKRRITEVIGCDIPEDEVSFLNDGRLTCLVCHSRPLLDTVEILKIHRKSFKHLQKYEEFQKKKDEKLQIIEKRLQLAEERGQNTSELLNKKVELLSSKTLVKQPVYKSRKLQPKKRIHLACEKRYAADSSFPITQDTARTTKKESTSQNRMQCLDQVAKTVPIVTNKDEKDFSKLPQTEKDKIRQRDLQLLSQGWKRDKWGNWLGKDPDVEFDSDEELPA